MKIFYFTGTGNSLAVAKRIGGELISIPQVINSKDTKYKDDVIGFIFPIYSLSAPKIVLEFINKVKIEAKYTFAIGTYGNMPGAAMPNLQNIAKKSGFSFDYTANLLMLDNFLPMFEIGKEIDKLPQKRIEEMTNKIVEDINNRKKSYVKSSIPEKAITNTLKLFDGMVYNGKQGQKYIIDDKCNKCGTCAKVCPVGNISVSTNVQFKQQCAACQACLHLCPRNAIHLKKEKSSKRWRNPEVSLKEIIDANNIDNK